MGVGKGSAREPNPPPTSRYDLSEFIPENDRNGIIISKMLRIIDQLEKRTEALEEKSMDWDAETTYDADEENADGSFYINGHVLSPREDYKLNATKSGKEVVDAIEKNEDEEILKVPEDSYAFIHLCKPTEFGFYFGLLVFIFQFLFQIALVLSIVEPSLDTNGAIADGSLSDIFPADVEPVVRISQILAIVAHSLFADESMQDVVTAINTFPLSTKNAKKGERIGGLMLSSLLRLIQGVTAAVATFYLVMTSINTRDVVLNFTAINFISRFDDVAFFWAKRGYYLNKALSQLARKVENMRLPTSVAGKKYPFLQTIVAIVIFLAMMSNTIIVNTKQLKGNYLDHGNFRIALDAGSSADVKLYEGCYRPSTKASNFLSLSRLTGRRLTYTRHHNKEGGNNNQRMAKFGYCKTERRWNLFVSDSGDDDPCVDDYLAYSSETTDFEIRNTIGDTWFGGEGAPLDIKFITDGASVEGEGACDSFLGDGICDEVLNQREFNWDEGDCCAGTCVGTQCGTNTLQNVFGATSNYPIFAYPLCKGDSTVPVSIEITDFVLEYSSDSWVYNSPPLLSLECDGLKYFTVILQNRGMETIQVRDGAFCTLVVRTDQSLSRVGYSISLEIELTKKRRPKGRKRYDGTLDKDPSRITIVDGNFIGQDNSISFLIPPKCFMDWISDYYIDQDVVYSADTVTPQQLAIRLMRNDDTTYSACENPYLGERFASLVVYITARGAVGDDAVNTYEDYITKFQCNWDFVTCDGSSVTSISLSAGELNGSLASEIALLTNLKWLAVGGQGLVGTIPTELGRLTELQEIYLDANRFSGTIPSELGKLSKLEKLWLQKNNLVGSIPSEFGNMQNLQFISVSRMEISGTLPSELVKMTNLVYLSVYQNNLVGRIPSELGGMPALKTLYLYNNMFYGSIPSQLGASSTLEVLYLVNNNLSGTIPAELGNMSTLKFVTLEQNNITGNVDSIFCKPNKIAGFTVVDCEKVNCPCCNGCRYFQDNPTIPPDDEKCPGEKVFNKNGCSICGSSSDGNEKCVRDPNATVLLLSRDVSASEQYSETSCGDLERSALAGNVTADACTLYEVTYATACGCA